MRRGAGWGWAAAVVAAGCEQPRTEFVVRVDSEVAWGQGQSVQSVVLIIRRGDASGLVRSARTTALGAGDGRRALPLYVGVIAGDDDVETPVWIEALGCGDPNGCREAEAVVAQRAVVRFTRGRTEEVPLLLASACVGVTCALDERCTTGGQCEAATRAQEMVRPFIGAEAGTATPLDATVDAGGVVDVGGDVGASMDVAAADVADAVAVIDVTIPIDGPATADVVRPLDEGSIACPSGMRLIPEGRFLMGSPTMGDTNARPVHGVQLTAFCMDETEVTTSAYALCVMVGSCTSPATDMFCNWMVPGRGDHPINCVDWSQARAYCQSRGGDLPTEAQWEFAARGADGRAYPWGNDAAGSQLCWSGGGVTRTSTCAVRSFPSGNSPSGLFDMAGNVFEWTLDWLGPYTGDTSSYALNPSGPASGVSRVLRGGPWNSPNVRATDRDGIAPTYRSGDTGFRCSHAAP
ncbi:MAG: SUMF1/EgtB/PvdO family nonheme iron enzyme [Deltaproteobacteria bacterium]|nr:SUMF1/EgtB/PvdO family nonheme iron enzyme [Myxococcales bacterium]MDP3220767.1 SUMF1/EgtB/PvdO family nonheme iron enzyme [Deltaproteobacteria bacterium]